MWVKSTPLSLPQFTIHNSQSTIYNPHIYLRVCVRVCVRVCACVCVYVLYVHVCWYVFDSQAKNERVKALLLVMKYGYLTFSFDACILMISSLPITLKFSSSGSALELTRAYEPEKSMDNLERLSQSINKKLSRSLSSFGMNNSTNSNHQPAAANDEVNISKGLMQTKDLEEEFVSSLLNSSLQPHT